MSKNRIDFQANNCICEAVECREQASQKIEVKVGNMGTVTLYLCSSCVGKFADN